MVTVDRTNTRWFKSSRSHPAGECVEVAWLGTRDVGVRDSKHPGGPALRFTHGEWSAFTGWVRSGRTGWPST
ncbi:DUF397 domain-containing protein [Nocardia sp. NPDC024068]|uniref:DUF397 domain-containing protein n=1 Tax=Nocardia sp. NPDC024068 TaxID=3157197 RepID=UPI0033E2C4EA